MITLSYRINSLSFFCTFDHLRGMYSDGLCMDDFPENLQQYCSLHFIVAAVFGEKQRKIRLKFLNDIENTCDERGREWVGIRPLNYELKLGRLDCILIEIGM